MLELGSYKSFSHYAVIGHPQDFYVYRSTGNTGSGSVWSSWIKGDINLYHKLKNAKNKRIFTSLVDYLVTERYH